MAASACKYHPQRHARFHCSKCRTDFCQYCASRDTTVDGRPLCALCRMPLAPISSDRLIPPFWTRLPRFILFPLQPKVLAFIAVLVVAGLLAMLLGPVGGLFPLFGFLVVFKYAYQVMAHAAEGHSDAPSPLAAFSGSIGPAVKQFVVFVILAIPAIPLTRYGGELGAGLASLFTSAIYPAGIMLLVTTESIGDAINPGKLVRTIRTIGAPYAALCGVLFLISASGAMMQAFLVEHSMADLNALMQQDHDSVDPTELQRARDAWIAKFTTRVLPLLAGISGYEILVSFALMGYVLYQFHSKLDLPVAVEIGEEPEAKNEHPLLGDVEVLIREGRLDDALKLLRERVIAHPGDLKLRDRFHTLLGAIKDVPRLTGHGGEYIGLLLRSNNPGKAATVWRDCRKVDERFALDSAGHALPIAKAMFQAGDHAGVVSLANGFHRTAPGHRDIPELYFLAARSLSEGLGRDAQARPILESLLKGYPQHALVPEITRYLGALNRLASPG